MQRCFERLKYTLSLLPFSDGRGGAHHPLACPVAPVAGEGTGQGQKTQRADSPDISVGHGKEPVPHRRRPVGGLSGLWRFRGHLKLELLALTDQGELYGLPRLHAFVEAGEFLDIFHALSHHGDDAVARFQAGFFGR